MIRPATPAYGAGWSAGLRRGTDAELRGWVEAALRWCGEADEIALRTFRAEDPGASRKPDGSFVTAADTAIEALILDRLAAAFPAHGAFGEEFGDRPGTGSVTWFIDPIDGTHNYLRGVPIFATLLGVARDGELQAGIVSAPALGGRWYAWRGGGAWAAGPLAGADRGGSPRRLHVSAIDDIAAAQVVYAGTRDLIASGAAPGFEGLLDAAWRERGFGDFWGYSLVAEGAAEVMVEIGLKMWDIAAPAVIVEEAGGRVTDFAGQRTLDGGTILATNGVLHESVRARLTGAEEGRER